jgi:fibronectin-binding autotransporter adhesin
MKVTKRIPLTLGVLFFGLSHSHGDPVTYIWGGSTGVWSHGGNWSQLAPAGAPPPGSISAGGGGGVPGGTIQFANHATSTYTSTYDFTAGTPPQFPIATFFNLNQLNLNGGATSATGNNTINHDPDELFHNLRFADNGGGIVNSTSNGIGYTLDIAVIGINTLNLSGNGTSAVSLRRGIFADMTGPPVLHIVKTGTSTFDLNGTVSVGTTTSIREGAIQFGNTFNNLGPINLGNSSGTADARMILTNGASLGGDGDITVVSSADGGTRTIQSTASSPIQHVEINGDIAINHSGGLRIDSGIDDAAVNLRGAISGSGDLIVAGTGKVATMGSTAAFTGKIVVESGSYANMSLFGGTGTVPVTVGNGAGNAGMNFAISTPGATYAQPITIGAGVGARDFSATENGALTGSLTLNRTADFTVETGKVFVIEGALSGATGGLDKKGAGTLTLSGVATPSSPGYTASTTITEGTLVVNRDLSGSAITVAGGATLGGSGSVGSISGGGIVSPGNSPGITTVTGTINPSGGLDFIFGLSQSAPNYGAGAGDSFNDILHLTNGSNPFTQPLVGSGSQYNEITVNFTAAPPIIGQVYLGGFYTDSGNYFSSIQNAKFNYSGLGEGQSVSVSMIQDSANFGTGNVDGYVTRFKIIAIPEPGRCGLLAIGSAVLLLRRLRGRGR